MNPEQNVWQDMEICSSVGVFRYSDYKELWFHLVIFRRVERNSELFMPKNIFETVHAGYS